MTQPGPHFPFVHYFDDAIAPNVCREMIQLFESNPSLQSRTYLKNQYDFTEVTISDPNQVAWVPYHNKMVDLVVNLYAEYIVTNKIKSIQQPRGDYGFEQFRMKRYLPNSYEYFGLHCDVGNYASARRYLAFLFYLNTVEDGGFTVFQAPFPDDRDMRVHAVEGRALVFPPLWTHPHIGTCPISGPKFVLSGYIHYL